ncbi:hypothetical protein [Desulfosarcina alkanivorans]|nr:hypothetical protein [Desulfosarcina alkanivorans]
MLESKHAKMGDVLMPLSMALITVFDDDYLGIQKGEKKPMHGQE